MSTILVDGIKDIVFHNGLVRIDCISTGAKGEQRQSGTLLIPGNVAGLVLKSLANAMQELDKKIHESVTEQASKAAQSERKN